MSFDHVTHRRNKEGKVSSENHYVRKVTPDGVLYERPPKSGNWYHEDGTLTAETKARLEKKVDAVAAALAPTAVVNQEKPSAVVQASAQSIKEAPKA